MRDCLAEITSLAKDESKQKKLSDNIAAFAVKNANKKIAEEILKSLPQSPKGIIKEFN